MIVTYQLQFMSMVNSVLLVERLPFLESAFTSSHPSLNKLCHSKSCALHSVIYTLAEAFQVLVVDFSPSGSKDFRFAWCSLFIPWPKKKRCKKGMWKRCNGWGKLKLQLYISKISCEMITQSTFPSFAHTKSHYFSDRVHIYIYIYDRLYHWSWG